MSPVSNTPISIAVRQTFSGVASFSTPVSIADWIDGSDWTLAVVVAASNIAVALVSIEDSADDFDTDIQVVATLDLQGAINPPTDVAVCGGGATGRFACRALGCDVSRQHDIAEQSGVGDAQRGN